MVLLPDGRSKLRAKMREEVKAESIAEGIAIGEARARAKARAEVERDMDRAHVAWTSWLKRMEECHVRGEPFKEPPPAPPGGRPKGWREGWDAGWRAGWIEGRTIGASDTVAQTHSAWAGWNARRMERHVRGEPFDEPPPAPTGGNGKSGDGE